MTTNTHVSITFDRVDCAYDNREKRLDFCGRNESLRTNVHLTNIDPGDLLDALADRGTGMRRELIAAALYALVQDLDEADNPCPDFADTLARLADVADKSDDYANLAADLLPLKGRP